MPETATVFSSFNMSMYWTFSLDERQAAREGQMIHRLMLRNPRLVRVWSARVPLSMNAILSGRAAGRTIGLVDGSWIPTLRRRR